jgi:hypothetical protein
MEYKLNIRWTPRKINLEVNDLNDISPLYTGETTEDFQGKNLHKKGAEININHMIKTKKYGEIMFIAPNPVEFYLYGSKKSLDNIGSYKIKNDDSLFKNNQLFFEMISFLIYLYSALEALINQKIPQDFIYIDGSGISFKKEDIESKFSIKEKVKDILNIKVKKIKYWPNILNFIQLRNNVTHLKTTVMGSEFKSYESLYKDLLDFNYNEVYEDTKRLMVLIYEN